MTEKSPTPQSGAAPGAAPAASAGPEIPDNKAISQAKSRDFVQKFIASNLQGIKSDSPLAHLTDLIINHATLSTAEKVMAFNELHQKKNDKGQSFLHQALTRMDPKFHAQDYKKMLRTLSEIFNNQSPELLPEIKTQIVEWAINGLSDRAFPEEIKMTIINPKISVQELNSLLVGDNRSSPGLFQNLDPKLAAIRGLIDSKNPDALISFQ